MRFADCLEKWLREWGMWNKLNDREAHLFAQSMSGLGPEVEDIELNESEQVHAKEMLRQILFDPEVRAKNQARVNRIIQNG